MEVDVQALAEPTCWLLVVDVVKVRGGPESATIELLAFFSVKHLPCTRTFTLVGRKAKHCSNTALRIPTYYCEIRRARASEWEVCCTLSAPLHGYRGKSHKRLARPRPEPVTNVSLLYETVVVRNSPTPRPHLFFVTSSHVLPTLPTHRTVTRY